MDTFNRRIAIWGLMMWLIITIQVPSQEFGIVRRISTMTSAFAINPDGSAKDPVAFKNALLEDQEKMKELQKDQKAFEIVKGDDIQQFQTLLMETYKVVRGGQSTAPLAFLAGWETTDWGRETIQKQSNHWSTKSISNSAEVRDKP